MRIVEQAGTRPGAAAAPADASPARLASGPPDMPMGPGPAFHSILFPPGLDGAVAWAVEQPSCFRDLNLDQATASIFSEWRDEDLRPFFHTPSRDPRVIQYRHAVFRDLEEEAIAGILGDFAQDMRHTLRDLEYARDLPHRSHRQIVVLDAIGDYCMALRRLDGELEAARPRSEGLRGFRAYVHAYVQSTVVCRLADEALAIRTRLDEIQYSMFIKRNRIVVRKSRAEPDYSARILGLFRRFEREGGARRPTRAPEPWLNHIEAGVLEFVARLFPEVFAWLDRYITAHGDFFDSTIALFVRQLRFYQAWLGYIAPMKKLGLDFCIPAVSATEKEFHCEQGFDLVLAHQLATKGKRVVANDACLAGGERILVVSGPNQGGKTTFARMFGQLHYLAGLGCTLPGRSLRIFLCDRVFTHFERREDPGNLRSKLEDDMLRVRDIYAAATSSSVVVLNEIFNSTPWRDQVFLSGRVLDATRRLGVLALCVTFIEELAALGPETVSMVAAVNADDAALRTFKVVRRAADGLAYAMSLAQKHGVSRERLMQRLDERAVR